MKEITEQTGTGKQRGKLLFVVGGMLVFDLIFLAIAAWRYELWWSELGAAAGMFLLLGGIFVYRLSDVIPKKFFWLLGLHFYELLIVMVSYPAEGLMRPVLSVPILIGCLAGSEAGVVGLIFYSVVSALICADPAEVILLYLAAGLLGICVFSGKKGVKGYLAGAVSFFVGYVVINLVISYYAYAQLQTVDLLYSAIGGALQLLPVICCLPFLMEGGIRMPGTVSLSTAVAAEFPAMAEFSEREPIFYKHSRLVARLSSQAAAGIGADTLLAEAGGLYHEIGKGMGEDDVQESLGICKKYRIPASVQDIIKEHNPDRKTPSSKEAAIVMISDTIVTMMEQNRKKNLNEDMEGMIARAFKKREDSGAFLLSGLTQQDITALSDFYNRILGRG